MNLNHQRLRCRCHPHYHNPFHIFQICPPPPHYHSHNHHPTPTPPLPPGQPAPPVSWIPPAVRVTWAGLHQAEGHAVVSQVFVRENHVSAQRSSQEEPVSSWQGARIVLKQIHSAGAVCGCCVSSLTGKLELCQEKVQGCSALSWWHLHIDGEGLYKPVAVASCSRLPCSLLVIFCSFFAISAMNIKCKNYWKESSKEKKWTFGNTTPRIKAHWQNYSVWVNSVNILHWYRNI